MLLLIILIFPAASITFVDLIPISKTVPLNPSTLMISPALYSFSKIINIPAMISAINDCAPSPTISVNTPTDATSAVVSTPNDLRIKRIIIIAHAYLVKPSNNVKIVF